MSHKIHKTSNRKQRSSWFLGCFRFSVKDEEKEEEKMISGASGKGSGEDKHSGRRFFRLLWFRRMKKSSAKTVPVNNSNFVPKLIRSSTKEIVVLEKDKDLCDAIDRLPADVGGGSGGNRNKIIAAEPNQVAKQKSSKVTTQNNGEHIILEKTKTLGAKNGTIISYNVSRPPRKQLSKSVSERGIHGQSDANFGSLVGISVLMVILIIMLIWGKLCAILCASVLFYTIASFRAEQKKGSNEKKASSNGLDEPNSKEYKKRVVLQGLLERPNHRK